MTVPDLCIQVIYNLSVTIADASERRSTMGTCQIYIFSGGDVNSSAMKTVMASDACARRRLIGRAMSRDEGPRGR